MAENGDVRRLLPPYLPYKSFKGFVDGLRQAVPSRIDRSLMRTMSGGQQSAMIQALRFLQLIEEDGRTTPKLHRLATSEGAERQQALQEMLSQAYSFVFKEPGFELKAATAQELEERFRASGATGDTVRKAVVFFEGAATDAGLELSPYIKKRAARSGGPRVARKRRSGSGTTAGGRVGNPANDGDRPAQHPLQETPPSPPPTLTWAQMLLSKFPSFDPAWPDEVKSKWFDAFDKLMERGEETDRD